MTIQPSTSVQLSKGYKIVQGIHYFYYLKKPKMRLLECVLRVGKK